MWKTNWIGAAPNRCFTNSLPSRTVTAHFPVSKTLSDHNLNLWRALRERWRKEGRGQGERRRAEREASLQLLVCVCLCALCSCSSAHQLWGGTFICYCQCSSVNSEPPQPSHKYSLDILQSQAYRGKTKLYGWQTMNQTLKQELKAKHYTWVRDMTILGLHNVIKFTLSLYFTA